MDLFSFFSEILFSTATTTKAWNWVTDLTDTAEKPMSIWIPMAER